MEDHPAPVDGLGHSHAVPDVGEDDLGVDALEVCGVSPRLDHGHHMGAGAPQVANDRGADEPGPAGDQHPIAGRDRHPTLRPGHRRPD